MRVRRRDVVHSDREWGEWGCPGRRMRGGRWVWRRSFDVSERKFAVIVAWVKAPREKTQILDCLVETNKWRTGGKGWLIWVGMARAMCQGFL